MSKLTFEQWRDIERDPTFVALRRARRRFVIPATVFFVVYYFALPVLVGCWPELMQRRVVGEINWAYLFALSQFFMAWAVLVLYLRRARRLDAQVEALVARLRTGPQSEQR